MNYSKPDHLDKTDVLYRVAITPNGLKFDKPYYRQCPECGGHVTHYGGGLWMCGSCDWQW